MRRPTAQPAPRIIGFHLSELYSPWRRLGEIAADFVAAKRGGTEMLRTWVNTSLGESWEEPAEAIDPAALAIRRERFAAEIPAGACCVTLGVDTQDDRLEALLVAWGPGEESWILRRETLPGDPAFQEPWRLLDDMLSKTYHHALGLDLPVHACCIGSAGHKTNFVYAFVAPRQIRRVFATIGRGGGGHAFVSPGKPIRTPAGNANLHMIDRDQGKATFFSRLRLTEPGPGYVHISDEVDNETIAQLTAEKLMTTFLLGSGDEDLGEDSAAQRGPGRLHPGPRGHAPGGRPAGRAGRLAAAHRRERGAHAHAVTRPAAQDRASEARRRTASLAPCVAVSLGSSPRGF